MRVRGDRRGTGVEIGVHALVEVGAQAQVDEQAGAHEHDASSPAAKSAVRRTRMGRRLMRGRRPCAAGSPCRARSPATHAEGPVDLLAQVADVDLDDVRAVLVAEIPAASRSWPWLSTWPGRRMKVSKRANSRAERSISASPRQACARGRVEPQRRRPRAPPGARRARAARARAGAPAARRARRAWSGSRPRPRRGPARGRRPRRARSA